MGRSHQDDDEAPGIIPGVEDDRALVQHGAPHPEPLGRADVVMEWAGGLLDRDQGTQTVGSRSGLDLKMIEF